MFVYVPLKKHVSAPPLWGGDGPVTLWSVVSDSRLQWEGSGWWGAAPRLSPEVWLCADMWGAHSSKPVGGLKHSHA